MLQILPATSARPTSTAAGHLLRLRRILSSTGKSAILPLDHAITFGPVGGLESPSNILEVAVQAGFDAVMLRPGLFPAILDVDTRGLGMISCLTGRLERGIDHVLLNSVSIAAASGADAVCAEFKLGSVGELENARVVSAVAEEAHQAGLPVLVTVYATPDIVKREGTVAYAHACRVAEELGADIIKTGLPDDASIIQQCVASVSTPIVVAGGTSDSPATLVGRIQRAVEAGASGAAVGRGIWGTADPLHMAHRIRAAVHDVPAGNAGS